MWNPYVICIVVRMFRCSSVLYSTIPHVHNTLRRFQEFVLECLNSKYLSFCMHRHLRGDVPPAQRIFLHASAWQLQAMFGLIMCILDLTLCSCRNSCEVCTILLCLPDSGPEWIPVTLLPEFQTRICCFSVHGWGNIEWACADSDQLIQQWPSKFRPLIVVVHHNRR